MVKRFTLFYFFKEKIVGRIIKHWEHFLNKGLSDGFSPSEQTLRNIRSFADAYESNQTENIGVIEYLKN